MNIPYPDTARWEHRKHLKYFEKTVQWIVERWQPNWRSIREVGSHDHGVLPTLADVLPLPNTIRFEAVDLERLPNDDRLMLVKGDFMAMPMPWVDVTVALHVIEHQAQPENWFSRLFQTTRELVIVGTPWMEDPTTPESTLPQYPPDHHVHHRWFRITKDQVCAWASRRCDDWWMEEKRQLHLFVRRWR